MEFFDYPLYVKIFNGIQYASVFSATLVGICYSFWVIIGLAWNPDHQNKYKDIILVLTVTHFLTCAFYAPLIPLLTFPTGLIYLFGRFYPDWLVFYLGTLANLTSKLGTEILAISMVYKAIFLMRPRWASIAKIVLSCIAFPIPIIQSYVINHFKVNIERACDLVCMDAGYTYPTKLYLRDVSEKSAFSTTLDYFMYALVILIGLPCMFILNRWFRLGSFSSRTMRLQKKLMLAWGSMIILQAFFVFPQFIFWLSHFIPPIPGVNIAVILTTISACIVYWIIPLRCIIIYFTLRKLLRYPRWLNRILKKNSSPAHPTGNSVISTRSR